MRRLVYVSHAVSEFEWVELVGLLAKSRTANEASGVTGVLFHVNGVFLQFLEGGHVAVERTMKRISADPRHTGIVILSDSEVTLGPLLPEWKMGFYHLRSSEPVVSGLTPGLIANSDQEFTDFLLADGASDAAGRLLAAFWRANRKKFLFQMEPGST
jgi:hypothetical protein